MATKPKSSPKQSLAYWKGLRSMMEEIKNVEGLEADFLKDPGTVLKKYKLDVHVPTDNLEGDQSGASLAEMLDSMTENERRATLDALTTVSNLRFGTDLGNIGKQAIAVPIANVNAAANHNVVANSSSAANAVAVSNALATANTTGARLSPSELVRPALNARMIMREGSIDSALISVFEEFQLNEGRQKALMKRALLDDHSIISAVPASGGAELRTAFMAYKGRSFEVEGLVSDDEITINKAKLVDR